jgi:hypothetical protein
LKVTILAGVATVRLEYSVYVAPSKPAVSDDLSPGEARRMWPPTASTLIPGERDAILVDPLMTIDESRP